MKSRVKNFVALLTLTCVSTFPFSGKARMESKPTTVPRVSADLLRSAHRNNGSARASVIVQFNTSASQIDPLLSNYGARITRRLNNLAMRVIELPLNAIDDLATHKEIRYISPDRPIGPFGHIETTTGTAGVRVQTPKSLDGLLTTTNDFDGNGIGIAIVDSGIDSQHVAFEDQLGISRVIVSQDFTGENRVDDVYGHGTHVASIAAGNNQIANGAYTGIAPAANLINLRILNSQGAGSTSSLLAALDWIMTYPTSTRPATSRQR